MKKIISVILCVAMLFSLSIAVFAAQGVEYVFADIEEPKAGAKPSYDASYGGVGFYLDSGNNNPNYYENGIGWYDVTANKNVPTSGKFEAGHQYKVMVFFKAKEGYEFPSGIGGQINGKDAVVTYFDSSSVMLEWTFPTLAQQSNPFTDVTEADYFYKAVLWAIERGITNGISATEFAPNASCTRGQIVTFLWRAQNCPEPKSAENPFTDISADAYYYKAVLWAVENGITSGMSATTFEPETICTRAQAMTFIWRANGKPIAKNKDHPFTDIVAGEYYYEAVLWAVEAGITNGISATEFGPANNCTRAQIVTFLYRALA